jgi:hypothetical protein
MRSSFVQMIAPAYLRPLPKSRVQEPLPGPLLDFLRDVHARIESGDERTRLPSDDLLQSEHAYGGLLRGTEQHYSFTYFPVVGGQATWGLRLTAEDIADLAWGGVEAVELWSCSNSTCGHRFPTAESTCTECDWVRGDAAAGLSPEEVAEAERLRLDRLEEHKQAFFERASHDPVLQRKLERLRKIIE